MFFGLLLLLLFIYLFIIIIIMIINHHVIITGGFLECEALTADRVGVKTQGGNITLGRMVGQQCVLDAQAADAASSESSTSASGR